MSGRLNDWGPARHVAGGHDGDARNEGVVQPANARMDVPLVYDRPREVRGEAPSDGVLVSFTIEDAKQKARPIGTISQAWEDGLRKGKARLRCEPDEPLTGAAIEWFRMGWRRGMRQDPELEQGDLFGGEA